MKKFIFIGFLFFTALCSELFIGQAQRQLPIPQLPEPCVSGLTACPNPTPPVVSVVFQAVNSPLSDNPTTMGMAGGKRIFPDKDINNPAQNRKVVAVKATVSPVPDIEDPNFINTHVKFMAYDVDDPSDDAVIDSNGTVGNDNRPGGIGGTLSPTTEQAGTTNEISVPLKEYANGEVIVYLTVTMQPGNNVVVAATTDTLAGVQIDGTGLKDGTNAPLPTGKIKRTELLTTWRKLHIEVDSMGVVTGNKIDGSFPDDRRVTNGTKTLDVSVSPDLEVNRFENGRIKIGNNFYPVINSNPSASPPVNANTVNTVTIFNNQGTFNITAGDTFVLYDDDDYNNNNGFSKLGNENELLIQFSGSLRHLSSEDGNYADGTTKNVLAEAYVSPEYSWASQYNNNIPLDLNVENSEESSNTPTALINANRGSKNSESDDFWVAYLIFAYQPGLSEDLDSNFNENPVVGKTPNISCDCYSSSNCPRPANNCTSLPLGGPGSLVFLETSQDYRKIWLNPPSPFPVKVFNEMETTVPHELGHQLGLRGDEVSTLFKIMDYQHPQTSSGNVVVGFHPHHINILRSRIKSPG